MPESAAAAYLVDTLLCTAGGPARAQRGEQQAAAAAGEPQPAALEASNAEMQVVPVLLPLVTDISTLRISIPADLRPADARKAGAGWGRAAGTGLGWVMAAAGLGDGGSRAGAHAAALLPPLAPCSCPPPS